MDTIARGKPEVVVPMLKRLGYDGLGGQAGDGAMADALKAEGLVFFNGYHTLRIPAEGSILTEGLLGKLDGMADREATLWLAVAKVEGGDELAVTQLRALAEAAEKRGVRIALYPHAGFWIDQVEDALRIAELVDREDFGITFNLCHWLKVEGSERDPGPGSGAGVASSPFCHHQWRGHRGDPENVMGPTHPATGSREL